MPLKVGDMVTARINGKMLSRVKGVPAKNKWVIWSQGSVGRIVGVKPINISGRGIRIASVVYLVKFANGVAELRSMHLEGARDESETISKAVMDVADPDGIVRETDLDREPGYL